MVQGEQFPGKGYVAKVAQQRHFKDVEKADERNAVDPLHDAAIGELDTEHDDLAGVTPFLPELPGLVAYDLPATQNRT
jgi:hypothetical protein